VSDRPFELHGEWPSLDDPTLIVMLTGWIDASGAAAAAMTSLDATWSAEPLVTFDPDIFIDYRARRPVMELRDGRNTRLVWEEPVLKVARDGDGQDVLLLCGPEPDSQWRLFCKEVGAIAAQLGVRRMVALGAYPFAAPHTRTPRLSVSSPTDEWLAELPYLKNSVDVPAGVSAALEHTMVDLGIQALGLWAQVPHYVSALGYPAATLALLRGLVEVTGLQVNTTAIEVDTDRQRERLDQLVAANDEHQEMVRQLETAYDSSAQQNLGLGGAMPSGDELAAEFERYLRNQDN
jgi:hypothetical protein